MKKFDELIKLAEKADAGAYLMDNVNPHTILAIAEAFMKLEQENTLLKQGCENNPLVHEMIDWRERAEAAEAEVQRLNAIAQPVKLPTTRLWAGNVDCYSKEDVISMLKSLGLEVSE